MKNQEWNPEFYWTNDITQCVDDINRPHEDYPVRNDITLKVLEHYIKKFSKNGKVIVDGKDVTHSIKMTNGNKRLHLFLFSVRLEIYKHAEKIKANKTTLVFLIATMTDKALTNFHKEFTEKK